MFHLRTNAHRTPPPPPVGAASAGNSKDVLVQKLEGAMQRLRRDRDQEYREKVEAQERHRLAKEETEALAKIVADLSKKHGALVDGKNRVEASLGPLEATVQDMTQKMQFQHNELLGARAKIQHMSREIVEMATIRGTALHAIRRLAHSRRQMVHSQEDAEVARRHDMPAFLQWQKAGLNRELNCLMFDWETLPKLMEKKVTVVRADIDRLEGENRRLERSIKISPSAVVATEAGTTDGNNKRKTSQE